MKLEECLRTEKNSRPQQAAGQFSEWRAEGYANTAYYFRNILRISLGYEPSHVSPKNLVTGSSIIGFDFKYK